MDLVSTTITNLTKNSRPLHWAGPKTVWLNAEATITVPFDVWSVANNKQKESIIAECRSNNITLTINVVNKDAEVISIPFDPSLGIKVDSAPVVVVGSTSSTINSFIDKEEEQMHTKIASTVSGKHAAEHFGATKVVEEEDTTAKVESTSNTGFIAEPVVKETTEAGVQDNDTEIKDKFNALVADKKWQEALDLLTATYGADRVTFSARTVMTMKDFDAIVNKYDLL